MSILDRAHGYMRAPREVLLSLKVWQHWHEVRVLRFDLEEEARNTMTILTLLAKSQGSFMGPLGLNNKYCMDVIIRCHLMIPKVSIKSVS